MKSLLAFVPWRHRAPRFVRAAHYFADGWPLDALLVLRRREVKRDLRRLRRDGFNTLIVVVPWRGVQVQYDPPGYDDFYLQQLELLLRLARRARLSVILRLAYTHQVLPGPVTNGIRHAQQLLTEVALQRAWLDYFARIREMSAAHRHCIGAFVSWEELWHAFTHWQSLSRGERKRLAGETGYAQFMADRGLDNESPIPAPGEPEQVHYLAFMNARLRQLFEAARERYPGLGVEYRADRDPYTDGDDTAWYTHDRFMDFEPARYAYWAPFMGAVNAGETLSVEAALDSLQRALRDGSADGEHCGQVLEQFNFVDDTLRYADIHARIEEEWIPLFLQGAAPLLQRYTGGYGVWAPRDYRCNVLYNAALLDGGRGWRVGSERSRFRPNGGLQLAAGDRLSQQLLPKVAGVPRAHPFTALTLRVCVRRGAGQRLRARVNGGDWVALQAVEARDTCEASLPVEFDALFESGLSFELDNPGPGARIDRLWLFHQQYRGGIRDADGNPGPTLQALQDFNALLKAPPMSAAAADAVDQR